MMESSQKFQHLYRYIAKIPLWILLTIPLLLQLLVTAGVIGYLYYQNWQRTAKEWANKFSEEVGDRVESHITNYLETPQLINRLNANAIRLGQLNIKDQKSLERHFLKQIQTFDAIGRIHFSNPQGGYISAGNDERGFSVAFTDNFVKGTLHVYGVDRRGQRIKRLLTQKNYDATQRPFYQKAMQAGKPLWTSVYVYIPARVGMGIAASYPLYDRLGHLQGVLSCDVTLTKINHFLSNLRISKQGKIYILDSSGHLVASSFQEQPFFTNADGKTIQLKATASKEQLIRLTAERIVSDLGNLSKIHTPQQLHFRVKGKHLFLRVNPLQQRFGLDWFIVTVLPESDFMVDIDRNNQRLLLLCGLTSLLLTGTGILTLYFVVQPIRRLQQAAKAISQGQWHYPIATEGVAEVAQLARAFVQMARQLDTSFQALKASEQKFFTLLNHVPIGIIVFDATGNPILINQVGEAILEQKLISHVSPQEFSQTYRLYVAGTNQFYPVEKLPQLFAFAREILSVDDMEIEVNNSRKLLKMKSIPVLDQDGNVIYAIIAFQDITEQRQAEKLREDYERELERWVAEKTKALQQSEERFRLAVTHAPDMFVIYDRDRRFLYVNEKGLELTGWTLDRFLGRRDEDLFPPEVTAEYLPLLQKTIATKKLQTQECTIKLPGQEALTLIVKYVPLLNPQGEIEQILGITFDITTRKQAEEALRQSEARLATLQQVAQIGSCEFDLQSQKITCSEATFYHWGLDPAGGEPTFAQLLQKVHPEDREILDYFIQQAISQGIPYSLDLRILRGDGSIRYLDCRGEPVFDKSQNRVVKIIGTSLDITERKWAEQALAESEALNRAIVNALPDLIICMHRSGTYLDIKPTTTFLTTASPLVAGKNLEALFSCAELAHQRLIATENALQTGEIQIYEFSLSVQGQSLWQEARVVPLNNQEVLILIRDLTERKQAELALQNSEQFLRSIFEGIEAGIFIVDVLENEEFRYVGINPAAERMSGLVSSQLRGKTPEQVFTPKTALALRDRYRQCIAAKECITYEECLLIKGKRTWWMTSLTPLQDSNQRIYRLIGTCFNIDERKYHEDTARQLAEREQLLRAITQRIHQSLDLEQILATTVNEVLHTLNVERALIFHLHEDGSGQVIEEVVVPGYPVTAKMLLPDEAFPQDCYKYYCQGKPRIVPDVHKEDWSFCLVEFMQEIAVKSKIVAPIIQKTENSQTKIWGLLIVHACSHPRQWQQSEADFLQQISNQLAIAIQQSQLYQQTRQQAQREHTLNRLLQAIRTSFDLETIFSTAVSEIGSLLEVMRANIVRYLPEMKVWQIVAGYVQNPNLKSVIGLEISDINNPIAEKLKRFEIVSITDSAPAVALPVRVDRTTLTCEDEVNRNIYQICRGAWLLVPLKVEQQIWGSLGLMKPAPYAWQTFEVELTLAVADQLAIAIQQAHLYHQLQNELTEHRQTEEALRESEELVRKAFDNAPIGIALVSLKGKFLKVNHSLCEILGYSEKELLQLSFADISHPDDFQQDLEGRQRILAGEIRVYQTETRYFHKQGYILQVLLSISLVKDSNRKPLYLIAQILDVSHRYKVDRMKDEFISIVSHELRTPLTAIRGSLGILETGVLDSDPEQAKELLQIALNNSERLVRLVNDILDLERLESGKVQLVMEKCTIANLLQQAIEAVQALAKESNITVSVTYPNIYIWAAADAIVQTLINLLSNAIKFSPVGSTVWLSAEVMGNKNTELSIQKFTVSPAESITYKPPATPDQELQIDAPSPTSPIVLFAIKDQGRGIPADKLETIFERFKQVDVSDSRRKGGTGLGLAICKNIVKQHGGHIWAESILGVGSTFYFTLPVTRKQA